ncbi:hypothetical protein IQ268_00370 [Oculatella sp. LEGE 06141]|uniref:ATPase, T2SS/T4P/T4SS family n=1 Tax=Oculatella sp. LEGE 06141 TaxID=1828648 RepID=UPI001882167D|nr:hypothetical protein [Oculatella sp. LEGE 06141]MBE9177029.1 hypothetical protein [Oculatella sp. LEGE 06141]
MTSPLSSQPEPNPSNPSHQRILAQFQDEWAERLNVEQMFMLIDGVLPFEACLYYQVIPLFLEGSRLSLGMVSPQDMGALEYVRRIISYLNYSLIPRAISSEVHQAILTAYLNHIGTQQAAIAQRQQLTSTTRVQRHTVRTRVEQPIDRNIQQTLIVDSPDDLEEAESNSEPEPPSPAPPPPFSFTPAAPTPDLPSTKILEDLTPDDDEAPLMHRQKHPPHAPSPLMNSLPTLDIEAKHLSSPIEILATLPPNELLEELLGRVLVGGIGRLYFERQAQYGRVLWSQNGVLQSVIDKLDPAVFQGVINELKRMTHLPLFPVSQPKNTEIEQLYHQTRLLLRFRFMPTQHGEEATLQVLRGAALKFYQQQRLSTLERDALGIAKQLQLKINEIRDRARSGSTLLGSKLDALPALSHLLRSIEHQLDALEIDQTSDD